MNIPDFSKKVKFNKLFPKGMQSFEIHKKYKVNNSKKSLLKELNEWKKK